MLKNNIELTTCSLKVELSVSNFSGHIDLLLAFTAKLWPHNPRAGGIACGVIMAATRGRGRGFCNFKLWFEVFYNSFLLDFHIS